VTSRGKVLTLIVILGFVALLLYNTLSAQRVECQICVEFNGGRNCATASHSTEKDAVRSAQTTACGPLANGMDQAIACDNTPPVSQQCRVP